MSGYDEETHKLSFKSYGWEDGLNNDVVMSIIEDDNGFLWLATEKGLSCFDRQRYQTLFYAKNTIKSLACLMFAKHFLIMKL